MIRPKLQRVTSSTEGGKGMVFIVGEPGMNTFFTSFKDLIDIVWDIEMP